MGGGIFGVTIANRLAKNNSVDLFESNQDILMAASDINQCRIHRGYHYPRSENTTRDLLRAEQSFCDEYADAVMNYTDNYYCIANEGSLTSKEQYLDFCNRHGLEFRITKPDLINNDNVQVCVKVNEKLFDHSILKKNCWDKLKKRNVNVQLKTRAKVSDLEKYDFVIISTYSNLNEMLEKNKPKQKNYQFEVCEKVFVKMPSKFKNKSILIMDGPFMSIDPVGNTGLSIIGDVVHTVLHRNIGKYPEIEKEHQEVMNKGIIKNPRITNYKSFIESASRFVPEVKNAEYYGSSYCIKTVLPNVDNTDERPTKIEKIDDKTITVFSGKIPTCVEAASHIEQLVDGRIKMIDSQLSHHSS